MRIIPDVASVIGPSTKIQWGQALIAPSLYGVIEIEEAVGGAMKLGVEALSKLTLAQEFSGGLSDLEQLAHIPEGRWIRTIILLAPVGNIVYVVLRGKGRVYLKRGEKLARLIEDERGISGQVRQGDILLLATDRFSKALPYPELSSVFDHEDAEAIAEKLTLKLHEAGGGDGGAALIFEVKDIAESEAYTSAPTQTVAQSQLVIERQVRKKHMGKLITKIRDRMESLPRRKLILGIVTICIVLFFALSIGFGIAQQKQARRNDEVARVLSEAERALEEGNALLDLNPAKGRERLQMAHDLLGPLAQSIPSKTEQGRQISQLFTLVSEQLTLAKNQIVAEPQVFFDPGLLKGGSRADAIALYEEQAMVLDSQGTVYALDVSSKNSQIVAGGNAYIGAKLAAIHGESIYILVGDEITAIRDKKSSSAVRKTNEWKKISVMTAYAGNLYLLDSGASRIWKYIAAENGFSNLSEYLNPDTFVDLSGATSMAIDGAVWVGTSDGNILRFVQGRQETFSPQGVDPAFAGRVLVYASDSTKNLYVLEPAAKRVVVLDKEGMYLGQYIWQTELAATSLAVSESNGKILALADGKLYSLDLK